MQYNALSTIRLVMLKQSLETLPTFGPSLEYAEASRQYAYSLILFGMQRAASPTCFKLPCLPSATTADLATTVYAPLPLTAFVDYATPTSSTANPREPGLIAIGTSGQLRFWEGVSMALTGPDRYLSLDLTLDRGEIVRHLLPIDVRVASQSGLTENLTSEGMGQRNCYILATSTSRLFCLAISFAGGRGPTLSLSLLSRPKGMLARLGSSLLFGVGPSIPLDLRAGILALSAAPSDESTGGRLLWAVKARSVECWKVDLEHGDALVGDWELMDDLLLPAVLAEGVQGVHANLLDLQILDGKARE